MTECGQSSWLTTVITEPVEASVATVVSARDEAGCERDHDETLLPGACRELPAADQALDGYEGGISVVEGGPAMEPLAPTMEMNCALELKSRTYTPENDAESGAGAGCRLDPVREPDAAGYAHSRPGGLVPSAGCGSISNGRSQTC